MNGAVELLHFGRNFQWVCWQRWIIQNKATWYFWHYHLGLKCPSYLRIVVSKYTSIFLQGKYASIFTQPPIMCVFFSHQSAILNGKLRVKPSKFSCMMAKFNFIMINMHWLCWKRVALLLIWRDGRPMINQVMAEKLCLSLFLSLFENNVLAIFERTKNATVHAKFQRHSKLGNAFL